MAPGLSIGRDSSPHELENFVHLYDILLHSGDFGDADDPPLPVAEALQLDDQPH